MKFHKDMLLLYAVTDRKWTGRHTLYEQIEDALKGGATMIQLREKDLPESRLVAEAEKIKELCHSYHVPLIINDNVKAALLSGADGVHVGKEDMAVSDIRKIVPEDFIIGATAKTTEQAKKAEQGGADYLGVGAVFPSPTKQDAIRITRDQLKEICSAVSVPAVAIGGITRQNIEELAGGKMAGAAVVSGIFSAQDIQKETALLKKKIQEEFLGDQLDAVFEDIYPEAVKIGMVSSKELIQVIGEKLRFYQAKNVVVDPVMVASSGSSLMKNNGAEMMIKELFPLASLITPNIPEAEILSGCEIKNKQDMEAAAEKLSDLGAEAVLLKGGHSISDADDLLCVEGQKIWIRGRRIHNPNTHGTGCTLSSAIASNLAKGMEMEEAVRKAKEYISKALEAGLDLGKGSGPLDHAFYMANL